jgi:hypothetical protein
MRAILIFLKARQQERRIVRQIWMPFKKKMMKTVKNNIQIFDKVKFRYQRGLELGQMQKRRKTKQVNQLRAEASSLMPLTEDWLLLTTDETPLRPCIQKDFHEQTGRLQEVIFYPKFHCELNFIKHFWCSCKWYVREHCEYSLESLRRILPEALKSVSSATINRYYRCMRILNAYDSSFHYGTKTFKDHVYKSHQQVWINGSYHWTMATLETGIRIKAQLVLLQEPTMKWGIRYPDYRLLWPQEGGNKPRTMVAIRVDQQLDGNLNTSHGF